MSDGTRNSSTGQRRFAWIVAGGFAALTLPRLFAHELWRDEAWLWLVVTESESLADLWSPLARSGQGYLFPLLCFLASKVWASPLAMQLVNLAMASSAAFVFARWAPFDRTVRALFVLGYFPFYEYAVLSRHYASGMLLLWILCAATRSRRPASAIGAAFGLLCQTTVYGYILALATAGAWLLDRQLRRREPLRRGDAALGLALALAGAIAGLVQLIPEPGTSFAVGWRLGWLPDIAGRVLQMPWRAFVPLPEPHLNFWNRNLLDAWPTVQAAAGLLVVAAALAFLWPRRTALTTFLVGAVGLGAFGYVKFTGALRHDGHWWLLFAAALWLGNALDAPPPRRSWREPALLVVLLLHCGAAIFASWMDLRHPFSNAARTAQLILRLGLEDMPLLAHREPPAAPVALALGRPLFFPSRGLFVTYPDWGPGRRELGDEELRCAARGLATATTKDVILVANHEVPRWPEVDDVGAVLGAIQATEDYHLYRLRHGRLERTSREAGCPQ